MRVSLGAPVRPLTFLLLLGTVTASNACGGGSPETTPSPSVQSATPTPLVTRTPGVNAQGVRYCAYVPGESEPVTMPQEVLNPADPTPSPSPPPIGQTSVTLETTERQMGVFSALRDRIAGAYVYPDFNEVDWEAVGGRYEALIAGGLSDADFYTAMNLMISELGDEHSSFQSPDEVAEVTARLAEGENFVGIGLLGTPIAGTQTGAVIAVFPGSPADEAGLRPHDLVLEVDGLPFLDEERNARSRGPDGTSFDLKYQRPGDEVRTVTVTRAKVSGFTPVDYCIVPDTRIGYIMLPTFADENVDDQVRAALQKMTADGPLDGLILDNRLNGGGSSLVLEPMLGFFTSGGQGSFVSRDGEEELNAEADDIGGTQDVPLVILVDRDTVSFAEIFAGVLQNSGRATVVGGRTAGNVENLTSSTFDADGSRVWLATRTFAPVGLEAEVWEGEGVVPDIRLPTRWDLFTEATDPALARAVELLD